MNKLRSIFPDIYMMTDTHCHVSVVSKSASFEVSKMTWFLQTGFFPQPRVVQLQSWLLLMPNWQCQEIQKAPLVDTSKVPVIIQQMRNPRDKVHIMKYTPKVCEILTETRA